MRLDDLWAYCGGYVRIRVSGPGQERFLNLAASRGHRLWRVYRTPRGLEVNTTIGSFRRLGQIRRRTGSRVRILDRRGLPFVVDRATRRPFLLAGALVSLLVIYLLSSMVWVVRIDGAHLFDPDLLREVAASQGLEPGVFKWDFDPRRVERGMLLAVNGLSWVAIEVHGVVATVRVVEKNPLERPEVILPPADLVAAKDGIITEVIVLAGRAQVREGDTVRRGDVLILGRQTIPTGEAPPPKPGEPAQPPPAGEIDVVAKGIVRARVWYQAYAEARLHTLGHEPTGRLWRRVAVRFRTASGWHEMLLTGWWDPPRGLYERHEQVTFLPPWRSNGAIVEIVTTVYTEVRDVVRDFTPEEAERAARDAAGSALTRLIPQGAGPASFHFEVVTKDDILIGVLASAEITEDIARVRERR